MKKKGLLGLIAFCGLLGLLMGKPQTVHGQTTAPQQVNKNFMVYYRAWRDKTMQGVNTSITDPNWLTMDDIPYEVNIVNVFSYVPKEQEELAKPYFDKLKGEYADNLHARGVKLVRGFDYSKLLQIEYAGDFPTDAEFDAYAQALIEELMTPWKLDGLDIDMESQPTAAQVKISDGVIKALSKYIGPKANNGTLFLYDSNASYMAPFENVVDLFDKDEGNYVVLFVQDDPTVADVVITNIDFSTIKTHTYEIDLVANDNAELHFTTTPRLVGQDADEMNLPDSYSGNPLQINFTSGEITAKAHDIDYGVQNYSQVGIPITGTVTSDNGTDALLEIQDHRRDKPAIQVLLSQVTSFSSGNQILHAQFRYDNDDQEAVISEQPISILTVATGQTVPSIPGKNLKLYIYNGAIDYGQYTTVLNWDIVQAPQE